MRSYILQFTTGMLLLTGTAIAQTEKQNTTTQAQKAVLTQNVRGRVIDAESKQPLTGVIVLLASNNSINTTTDDDGYFVLNNVPIGRQSFQFSYIGFEPYSASEVMLISGKELDLNISMNESLNKKLDEVVVSASKDGARPLNEYASISARSFSVEETRRYAASFADPARMVMNFPGVSNGGDQDNSIVVRGNSPKGVLWKLEGIEIPNPNHFSSMGATGGAVSMLNANTLGTSDFFTGAFTPEYGNALAGAFDLHLRNGNTDKYEHTIQLGTLGAEIATEGPFKKGKKASYLFNYRYSTLVFLGRFFDFGTMIPEYQDGSFKINLPTEKAGTFSVFGLGGYNKAAYDAVPDSSKWNEEDGNSNVSFNNTSRMGVAGISHQYFLSANSYLKTIVSASYDKTLENADTLNVLNNYKPVSIEDNQLGNTAYRASVLYNQKLNARNTMRTGVIIQHLAYNMQARNYDGQEEVWKTMISSNGSTQYYQGYFQMKSRLTERLTFVGGLHGSFLALNDKYSIEPRASLAYQMGIHKMTVAAGLHTKPEHISTYLFQNTKQGEAITHPNKNLDLSRAFHGVVGYETSLFDALRFKAEVYYQRLYSIPVESDIASDFSLINAFDIYSLYATKQPLVNEGTGENYGIDLSIEKSLSRGYYIITTGSVYNSTYTNYKGDTYNTRFNRGYQANLIGGKEIKLNARGNKILGLNGKILFSGGLRESPIDLAKSIQQGTTILVPGKYFTNKTPDYFRTDMSIYYKMNRKRATHSIQLDVQNITNRANYYFSYFNAKEGKINTVNQLGIFPNLSYRVDFHW